MNKNLSLMISNVDDDELAVVVEPYADERSVKAKSQLIVEISSSDFDGIELAIGNRILSVYIPDEASYAFKST